VDVGSLYERAFAGESIPVASQGLGVDGSRNVSTFEIMLTPVLGSDGHVSTST
jgi:hypothetical protein